MEVNNIARQIISNVLDELGQAWQTVEEISMLPKAQTSLNLLQQHLPEENIFSMSRDEVEALLERSYWPGILGNKIESPAVAESIFRAVWYFNLRDGAPGTTSGGSKKSGWLHGARYPEVS